jgi:cation diffusion facilitator CzcD-associated flavoprotein CzcO
MPQAYAFWRDYVRSRVKDPRKAQLLAPTVPPHPWGTKRPSLEQSYYEVYNLPNVDLIDLEENPIEEFTATGIRTRDGLQEFDLIILATGFDALTGSLGQLDIRGTDGNTIAEHWQNGLRTSIGISIHGFPNMFFLYGPQAPTAFSNGPSCTQIQARWIDSTISDLAARKITRLEATEDAEDRWSKLVNQTWDATLFPNAKSWYNGSNIPGKRIEPLSW